MDNYTPEEYNLLLAELDSFIFDNGLDYVSVSSLLQGSIDFIAPEYPKATVAIIDTNDYTNSKSIKLSNVRVNLMYALDTIFVLKSIADEKELWLILALLKAIITLIKDSTVDICKEDAIVLYGIYQLRKTDEDRLNRYISDFLKNNSMGLQEINIINSLKNLEKIKAIVKEDGQYSLNEIVYLVK